jgi:hypothetical protein
MLIVRGGKDLQVAQADADALRATRADAKFVGPADMNHVLKDVKGDDRASNLATYADPSLSVDPSLVDAIAAFVRR